MNTTRDRVIYMMTTLKIKEQTEFGKLCGASRSTVNQWLSGNIKKIDLGGGENKLTVLSESIGKFTNLESLSLFHNKLKSLPKSFKKLDKARSVQSGDIPSTR